MVIEESQRSKVATVMAIRAWHTLTDWLGVDIQLGLAIDSTKATLAVKRKLACEMVKYWQQERDASEESGWKLVHGDVFRPPRNLVLLLVVVGTGAQLKSPEIRLFDKSCM
ncbi:transmembrane 9 superfamily member 1, partial [Tanacetum coccineum]